MLIRVQSRAQFFKKPSRLKKTTMFGIEKNNNQNIYIAKNYIDYCFCISLVSLSDKSMKIILAFPFD